MEKSEAATEATIADVPKLEFEPATMPPGLTKLRLTALGNRPYKCPQVVSAYWLFRSTHESVAGLFDTLYLVRERAGKNKQSTTGPLSRDAQDLLRAAIVFTSAGLDACMTDLLADAVPCLSIGNSTARGKFERYVDSQVTLSNVPDEFRDALKGDDPRQRMVDLYVASLTKASFQGSGDIKDRAREALGITNAQIPSRRITELDQFFTARNDIVHRMDHVGSSGTDAKPARQQRRQDDVRQMCDRVFLLIRDMISATADNIKASICRDSRTATGDARPGRRVML